MLIEIKNRWTNKAQYVYELPDEFANKSYGLQLGFAVKKALAENSDLSGTNLFDADLCGVALRDVDLRGANMRQVDLRGADLRGANMRGATLHDVDMHGANMRGADLRGAKLSDCTLRGVELSGTDLRGVELRGVELRDFGRPVTIHNVHQAIYAAASQEGALNMSRWHCGTAHCRAGWAVTLAGEDGQALEQAIGTSAAAAMIYIASDPTLERIPDFHCDNDATLADMRLLAKREAMRLADWKQCAS